MTKKYKKNKVITQLLQATLNLAHKEINLPKF
jgi:hypothetical protein